MSDRKLSPALMELAAIERAGARLGAEVRLRPSTKSTVLILDNTVNYFKKKRHFGAPGTITVFLGRHPSSLTRVIKAAEEGEKAVDEIVKEIEDAPRNESASLEEAFNRIADSPVIATLKYGGKTLVENLAIPEGRNLLGLTLPYSGGRIATKGLELEQSYRGTKAEQYTAVALATCPPLTPAETAALSQVPEEELLLSIGSYADCTLGCVGAVFSGAVAGGLGGVEVGGVVGAAFAGIGAGPGAIAGGFIGAVTGGWAGYEVYNAAANAVAGVGNNAGQAADAGAAQADAGAGDGGNAGAGDAGAGDAGAGDAGAGGGGGGDGGYLPFFGVVADGGYKYQVGDPYADIVSRETEGTARKLLEARRVQLLKSLKKR